MPTPEEMGQMASMGAAGWLGWLTAMAFGGLVAFRRIWHNDRVMSANSAGMVDYSRSRSARRPSAASKRNF